MFILIPQSFDSSLTFITSVLIVFKWLTAKIVSSKKQIPYLDRSEVSAAHIPAHDCAVLWARHSYCWLFIITHRSNTCSMPSQSTQWCARAYIPQYHWLVLAAWYNLTAIINNNLHEIIQLLCKINSCGILIVMVLIQVVRSNGTVIWTHCPRIWSLQAMTIHEFRRGITVFLVVGNPAAPISTQLRALF